MAPLPSRVVMTGAWSRSARATNAAEASPRTTPPPATLGGALEVVLGRDHGLTRLRLDRDGTGDGFGERLRRHLDLHRPRSPAPHEDEGLVHGRGDLVGARRPCRPLRDRADELELIVHVVQQAEVAADAGPVDLPGQEE